MIVCHCNAVTDRTIRETIRAGASTCKAVARNCGAGVFCGGCMPEIHALLQAERAHLEPAPESLPAGLEILAPA